MKQTEIGLIPDDWEVKRLGEIYSFKYGEGNKNPNNSGMYPIYGANGIIGKYTKYNAEDSIVIGHMGEYAGSVIWAEGKHFVTYNGTITKPKDQTIVEPKYGFYALYDRNINAICTGSGYPFLAYDKLNAIQIALPPFAEQQRIAKALSDVDAVISTTEKLIQKKKNIKQGAMQNLLTGKKRLPGFATTSKFKQTELGEIPEDWEVKKIKDFAKVFDGTHQTPHYVDIGIPFYSVENVTANNFEHTKLISEEEHILLTSKVKIEKGDILMTRIGSIGDCKYVDWEPNASFYVSLALIKCDKSVDAKFVAYYSNSLQFKKELELRSLITAIPQKINLGPISEIVLCVPSKEEQTAIANVLSSMDKEIETLSTKLKKYRNLKTAMMQQLLTGKIRLR